MILKAGKYFIGDPCYVIDDPIDDGKRWDRFCDEFCGGDGIEEFDGENIFVHHTMYGDGCFAGTDNHNYPVDAGIIGVIPISLCTSKIKSTKGYGRIVNFKKDFSATYENGIFYIGDVEINTN